MRVQFKGLLFLPPPHPPRFTLVETVEGRTYHRVRLPRRKDLLEVLHFASQHLRDWTLDAAINHARNITAADASHVASKLATNAVTTADEFEAAVLATAAHKCGVDIAVTTWLRHEHQQCPTSPWLIYSADVSAQGRPVSSKTVPAPPTMLLARLSPEQDDSREDSDSDGHNSNSNSNNDSDDGTSEHQPSAEADPAADSAMAGMTQHVALSRKYELLRRPGHQEDNSSSSSSNNNSDSDNLAPLWLAEHADLFYVLRASCSELDNWSLATAEQYTISTAENIKQPLLAPRTWDEFEAAVLNMAATKCRRAIAVANWDSEANTVTNNTWTVFKPTALSHTLRPPTDAILLTRTATATSPSTAAQPPAPAAVAGATITAGHETAAARYDILERNGTCPVFKRRHLEDGSLFGVLDAASSDLQQWDAHAAQEHVDEVVGQLLSYLKTPASSEDFEHAALRITAHRCKREVAVIQWRAEAERPCGKWTVFTGSDSREQWAAPAGAILLARGEEPRAKRNGRPGTASSRDPRSKKCGMLYYPLMPSEHMLVFFQRLPLSPHTHTHTTHTTHTHTRTHTHTHTHHTPHTHTLVLARSFVNSPTHSHFLRAVPNAFDS